LSIRARLLLLVVFSALTPAMLVGIFSLEQRETQIADARQDLATLTRYTAKDLEDRVRGTAQLLYGLARAPDLDTPDKAACSAFLAAVLKEHPQYTGILTITPNGDLHCDSLRTGRVLHLTDRDYFQKARVSTAPVIVEPVFGRLTGIAVLQVAYAARRETGELKFVLLASLNLKKYTQLLATNPPFPRTVFALMDRKGTVLVRHPERENLAGTSIAGSPLFRLVGEHRDEGVGEERDVDGELRVWAINALPNIPDAGLYILAGVSKRDLAAAANRRLTYALSILVVVLLLVVSAAWLLAELGIRRQVGRIVEVVDRLSVGDLGARVSSPHPRGELGQLMASLNHTAESLEGQHKTIESLNRRLTALIDSSPAAIVCLDTGGKVTLWNPAAERVFGWAAAEVVGQMYPAVPDAQKDQFAGVLARVMGGEAIADGEGVRRTKDGRLIDVAFRSAPLYGDDGRQAGMISVVTDMTEKLSLEKQLRQSQKMEAIGRLAGGVAHDFNNLLTIINGRARMAASVAGSDGRLRRSLAQIVKAGDRAAALTQQLLAFSRQQVLQPEVLDLNDVVRGVSRMLERLIGEDIAVTVSLAERLRRVKADRTQVEQVIMNFVINARDAMPHGGRLTIETTNIELDEAYAQTHPDARPGRHVMLAVSDTGVGMDAATQAKIFEPFFTTKESGKGTGLGLSMAYGIARQSGGNIAVYSEPGRGSSFKVYLPATDEVAENAPPAPVEAAAGAHSGTLLLVEDDPEVRELIREITEVAGYTVLVAPDPLAALETAAQCRDVIHLLLTDVVMPHMDGTELAERLSASRPGLRVLYVSGYAPSAAVEHGLLKPGTALVHKPFTPDLLLRKVREVLAAGSGAGG
jgi:PAS domain S-box-containing protein